MTLLEKIELEFTPALNKRVLQEIKKQTVIYSQKYPFVGKLTIVMGAVAVCDRDGIIMHDTNWKDHDKRNPNGVDTIFDQIQSERQAASCDEFVQFLADIQYSRLCTIQVMDILL